LAIAQLLIFLVALGLMLAALCAAFVVELFAAAPR
jgi:hypothetical protein